MQPVSNQPGVLLPSIHGRAIDDEYTGLMHRVRGRTVRIMLIFTPLALALIVLGIFAAPEGDWPGSWAVVGGGIGVLAVVVLMLVISGPVWWRGAQVLAKFSWRGVPARVHSDKPFVVLVPIDGVELALKIKRLNWFAKQVVLRTGWIWVCGPDAKGRAAIRVAGSVAIGSASVVTKTPTDLPPRLAEPTGPRPADEPALAWIRRRTNRSTVISTVALALVFAGGGLSVGLDLSIDATSPYWVFYAVYVLFFGARVVLNITRSRSLTARFDAAQGWLPVPVSLDEWDNPPKALIRSGRGRVILPNGWRGYLDFPRLTVDLAANMRATGTLWLAGGAAPGQTGPGQTGPGQTGPGQTGPGQTGPGQTGPGQTVAIGLPGYPLRGLAKISEEQSN